MYSILKNNVCHAIFAPSMFYGQIKKTKDVEELRLIMQQLLGYVTHTFKIYSKLFLEVITIIT